MVLLIGLHQGKCFTKIVNNICNQITSNMIHNTNTTKTLYVSHCSYLPTKWEIASQRFCEGSQVHLQRREWGRAAGWGMVFSWEAASSIQAGLKISSSLSEKLCSAQQVMATNMMKWKSLRLRRTCHFDNLMNAISTAVLAAFTWMLKDSC